MTETLSLFKEIKSIHPFVLNFVLFTSAFLPLLASIVGFLKWLRKNKIEDRIDYQFKVGTKTAKFIADDEESLEFYKRTKVLLTKSQREILINFFNKHQLQLRWKTIASAVHSMKFKQNDFDIILTQSDKISDVFTLLLFFVNIFFCILCIILSVVSSVLIDYKSTMAFFYLAVPFGYGSFMFNHFRQPYLRTKMVYNVKNLQN